MTDQHKEQWEGIAPAARLEILRRGGKMWADAVDRLQLRKHALELAVAAVGPQHASEYASPTADKIEQVANRLLAWLEKDKPTIPTA